MKKDLSGNINNVSVIESGNGGDTRKHSEDDRLLIALADLMYANSQLSAYGGNILEYLSDNNISDFDLYLQNPKDGSSRFLIEYLWNANIVPANVYGSNDDVELIYVGASTNVVKILPINKKSICPKKRPLIALCIWKYELIKTFSRLNFKTIMFGSLVYYALYKNIILKECDSYCREKGVNVVFAKFPQANHLKTRSKWEQYISSHSIYGYTKSAEEYIHSDEIVHTNLMQLTIDHGIQRLVDTVSTNTNIVNGFRVTTDLQSDVDKTIWIFGSSVVFGVFAKDSQTISSALQRELNSHNLKYNCVNCSNYAANKIEHVPTLLKSLPIRAGDICIFYMEFPDQLVGMDSRIIAMSKYFERPHDYGEIFVDINHMTGSGYCIQGEKLFDILSERGYFSDSKKTKILTVDSISSDSLTESENIELRNYLKVIAKERLSIGAIVMNCNPFTLGHRYLIEYAASQCDKLYIFVVEEDKSFFPFKDRFDLVVKGTSDIKNVTVLPSGKFIISQRTFAAYSNKANLQEQVIDPSMDVNIFARSIAPALGINIRFAGEEPLDNITRQYNDTMRRILPMHNIQFIVIKRKESEGTVISASRVRALLKDKRFSEIKKLVPATTMKYLLDKFN